jgi:hypothetical protein
VAVVDVNDMPILDTELPLQATLLYENGLPVKQLSNSEPLLVGEPEVVALQGSAVFKLRITSLSSHRDKQRFRIQIAPQSGMVRQHEPALTIVTDPMKSVTKLAHRSTVKDSGGAGGMGMPGMMGGPGSSLKTGGGEIDASAFEAVASTLKQHTDQIGCAPLIASLPRAAQCARPLGPSSRPTPGALLPCLFAAMGLRLAAARVAPRGTLLLAAAALGVPFGRCLCGCALRDCACVV